MWTVSQGVGSIRSPAAKTKQNVPQLLQINMRGSVRTRNLDLRSNVHDPSWKVRNLKKWFWLRRFPQCYVPQRDVNGLTLGIIQQGSKNERNADASPYENVFKMFTDQYEEKERRTSWKWRKNIFKIRGTYNSIKDTCFQTLNWAGVYSRFVQNIDER